MFPPPRMSVLPVEILLAIWEELAEDKEAFLALGMVSKRLSLLTRPLVFCKLAFHDHADLINFAMLSSAPESTIPQPLKCKSLDLKDVTNIFQASEVAQTFLHSIIVEDSLAIALTNGGLPEALIHAQAEWKASISKLEISGGNHIASTIFTFISSFPNLQFLQLRYVEVVAPQAQGDASAQFAFPPGMTHLGLSHCPDLWMFVKLHILPGGGFADVKWLYVQEKITLDVGVVVMFDCFKARQFEGVTDIVLDAVYDAGDPHADIDMAQFLVPAPFLKMRKLKTLRLNLAHVPSRVATNFLGWCSLYRSSHSIEVINIHVPHSTALWPEGSPFEELESLLDGMEAGDPAMTTPDDSKAKLVVRGFPGPLPQNVSSWGNSAVSGTSGYTIAFQECDWKQALGGVI